MFVFVFFCFCVERLHITKLITNVTFVAPARRLLTTTHIFTVNIITAQACINTLLQSLPVNFELMYLETDGIFQFI